MRFHKTVPKIAKVCYHGIDINKPCVKCIEYFIRDHQTSIKLLKQQLRLIQKHEKKKRTIESLGIDFKDTKRGRRK